jgi:subtilisin family serine protease
MKRITVGFLLFTLLLCLSSIPAVSAQSGVRSYLILANGNSLPAGLQSQVAAAGGQVSGLIPQIGIAVATSANPNFANSIQGVRSVVPNLDLQWLPDSHAVDAGAAVVNPPNATEDDNRFNLQWFHDSVNSREAWNAGQRGAGVVVAVLDTGFVLNHPDLSPNIIDAISFVPGESATFNNALGSFSHGTHVAGIIASPDNGIGGIGVAPEAKIVGVKVLRDSGSGSFDWLLSALVYTANRGDVDIINMSLGAVLIKSGVPGDYTARDAAELLVALSRATTYATQRGIAVFASAGNSAIDLDHTANAISIPAQSANVITIAATGPLGWALNPNTNLYRPASYTNFGRSAVDFAGPGGDFALPGNDNCTVAGFLRPCWVFDMVLSTSNSASGYSWAAGTSMASPAAAGVAAIIVGEKGGTLSPAQVKTELLRRALGSGNNPYFGGGNVQTGY